ncbi:MAG: putative tRNA threonylcarbamoyladenosine biosynthesis protein Gcp, partial [Candidatus Roizmanbacteria bacterium GW2011_GWA1_41_13]
GPIIERLAKEGDEYAFNLPIPMKGRKDLTFSYSGLKTAVRYLVDDVKKEHKFNRQTICDIAASFQRVATASLIDRLKRAVIINKPKGLLLGGGVISNVYVRNKIRSSMKTFNLPVYIPYSKKLFTDNAGMIGVAAYFKAQRGEFVSDVSSVDRKPNLNFTDNPC